MSLVKRGGKDMTERFRPRRMSEVAGCESAVKMLSKAITQGETRPKAFLLFGTRGCVIGATKIKVRKCGNGVTPIEVVKK